MNSLSRWIIFRHLHLSEPAFDFAVLSIESGDNIGSVLPWQQLPKKLFGDPSIYQHCLKTSKCFDIQPSNTLKKFFSITLIRLESSRRHIIGTSVES